MKNFLIKGLLLVILLPVSLFSAGSNMETIGVLSGQNLYFMYTSLSMLADAQEAGIYKSDFTINLAKDIQASSRKSRASLQKLIDDKSLSSGDSDTVKGLLDVYDSLDSLSLAVVNYAESRNTESKKQVDKYRTKSWERIQLLLKLEE